MRIYLSEKVIFYEAARPKCMLLLRVDKYLCLPKLKSITVLLYYISTIYERKLSTLTFAVEVMFNLRTFSHVLATVIKKFNVV